MTSRKTRTELPEFIRLSVKGRIVAAQCVQCGAFVGGSQSFDSLEVAIRTHACVVEYNEDAQN